VLDAAEKARLQAALWPGGKLSATLIAQAAPVLAKAAGLSRDGIENARFLMVEESGFGRDHPFSGEKLSPVLAVYRASGFEVACEIVKQIYAYQGAGHSVSLHSKSADQALKLGLELEVGRVIVNQAHAIATGGSFDNGLPFSLSMGCGTWGGNSFSDNMSYRHYLNITRISRPIAEKVPTTDELLGGYLQRYGA